MCLAVAVAPAGATAKIRTPAGVEVQRVAAGLGQPTNVAFDARGGIWTTSGGFATTRSDGVWYVRRRGARPRHVVRGLYSALGLTWFRGELYVAHVTPYRTSARRHRGRVVAYSRFDGRRFRRKRTVVRGIPTGLHRINSIVPGPGGRRLYLGVGSSGNRSAGSRLGATVVSFRPNGRGRRVEARGLRNPYGLAFVPGTRRLLVSDNGRDDLGNNRPPEELNMFRPGASGRPHFGFPRCWGRRGGRCRGTRRPIATLPAHSAPGGVAAVRRFGRFGRSAFVTTHGSTIATPPTGGVLYRVPLRPGRRRARVFARGFRHFDPLGVARGPGGALYVTLWRSGRVIRLVP